MERLAPPLECLLEIKWSLSSNHSFRDAVKAYLARANNDFSPVLADWMIKKAHGQPFSGHNIKSPYRKAILQLFERAWDGEPIMDRLNELELEVREACDAELESFVQKIPFLAMMPILLFLVPAYLLLLLGPVLTELIHSFALAGGR